MQELIKSNPKRDSGPTSSVQNPTSYSSVYLRLQPFLSSLPPSSPSAASETSPTQPQLLQFILYLSDPDHQLTHTTVTQGIPAKWLDAWDKHDWIEDLVVDVLRVGVEVVGQEYIATRMGWLKDDAEVPADAPPTKEPPT